MNSPASRPKIEPEVPHRGCFQRVVIVEDHPDGRESLRMLLETWGYDVEVAEDGCEGVRKILDWQPDVAVVDIGLPLLDGFQVARQVRAVLKDRILLIALTAYGQPQDRDQAFAHGFDFFMTKPADLGQLSRLLGRTGPARQPGP